MVTIDSVTQEVKTYDMAELFTYHHLKEKLVSTLQRDECVKLVNYFSLSKDQTDIILRRDPPGEILLLALEEKGVIQPTNVDGLIESFLELKIVSSCYYLVDFYKKTRTQATLYGRFLATLSAHLTASLPTDLCGYFKITDEKKLAILSSQNPGLSLLLALDETGIIKPSDVEKLEQPFDELRLVQARAKVDEYQVQVRQERADQFKQMPNLTKEEQEQAFIECLQRKIKSWYETMTPVPWKRSCRWKSSELFVGSGLILTDSKAQGKLTDIDPHCKLEYQDVLTHERLLSERRLILEGEPGCGKTMLSSQLAYDWAQNKFKNIKILIFLPLKFVEGMKLVSAVRKFYFSDSTPVSEEDIEATLNRGDISTVIILDGLEEYNSPVTKAEREPTEVHEIMSKTKYPGCKVVLTSRSDYAQDLPECPMLKLGRFGETERNNYIQKVFPDNLGKQQDIKRVIEDTPFILDLCSVPLLFVLAVHNIEVMHNVQKGQLKRVTPFMEGMVDTLCPFTDKSALLTWAEHTPGGCPIEKLAFNGLCKGFQQLSWQKDFMERKIDHIKEWIDSGVLIIEEGFSSVLPDQVTTGSQIQEEPVDLRKEPLDLRKKPFQEKSVPSTSGLEHTKKLESSQHSEEEKSSKQTASGTTAKLVALRLKFLHKVFQEWFAAKYLSSVIWFKNKESFSNQLTLIDPIDLHYVLRFTCYLRPPSCHIVLNHLLNSYRSSEGIIPKHIMDCICLCYTEYNGTMGEDIKGVLSNICKETISIQSQDSRLLQQSKVALLRFASQSGIPIENVQLMDVVRVAEENQLTFDSDVTLDALDTLRNMEVSRWDQTLTEEHYSNLLTYFAASKSMKTVNLSFPSQPPMLQPNTLEQVASKNMTVHWQIGQVIQTLDPSKGQWMTHLKGSQIRVQETSTVLVVSGQVSGESSTLSILPETSEASVMMSSKQEASKRPSTELASSTSDASVIEGRTKMHTKGHQGSMATSSPAKYYSGTTSATSTSLQLEQEKLKRQGTQLPESYVLAKKKKVNSSKEDEIAVEVTQPLETQVLLQQSLPTTEAIITKNSATVTIPGTNVVLNIPPGALPEHMDKCVIKMRIIPQNMFKDPAVTFSSNTSVVVEILPDSFSLQRPARLMIPHCLVLKENKTPKAKIYMSHHKEGCSPYWVEHSDIDYSVKDTHSVVWLNSFCWIKIIVDDKEVLAKKLILYTCGKKLEPTDKYAKIVVGYYLDLDGEGQVREHVEGKFLSLNKSMIVSERSPFTFMKEGSHPLCLSLEEFSSSKWKLWFPQDGNTSQEIAFKDISASVENQRKFVLEKTVDDAVSPMCMFQASQEEGQQLQLEICPELCHHSPSHPDDGHSSSRSHSQPQINPREDAMNLTFLYLSKSLGQEWMALGRELVVGDADLSHIERENTVTRDAIYSMLLRWKQKGGSDASYAILIKSLEEVGRKDLAEKLLNRKDLSR